ncbi:MAG: alternate F1F0 ATPase, F1 subunit alpha, partial [Longimicrobiales bacterium]|nr:alternate F1F0 ATPase, F1 subunit alpha [Longimicrobiales bacterium]
MTPSAPRTDSLPGEDLPESDLSSALNQALDAVRRVAAERRAGMHVREVGIVRSVGRGTARVHGLSSVHSDEVVTLAGGIPALVFNLDPDEIGVILLGDEERVEAGSEARAAGHPLRVPVGEELLGRIIDPLGRPLDRGPALHSMKERPVHSRAPGIMKRGPVQAPLQTGIKVVDALVPVGRGQRELIVGDRQTGKTAIAVDTILNQRNEGVVCIYCAVGQRMTSVARVVEQLRREGALEHTIVVVSAGEDPPGLQFVAPYAATAVGEHFMERGRDVLVVYDDLTRHARAYRELSLLLRRPPGREGYPGDIFYVHARLLERSTRLREAHGGGSLTALPVVETQAGNLSAYIPTNLISITDGQIYLSPELFRKGVLPAVDVGRSVSRVGGSAQLPAYRAVVRDLRLAYAQFQELEVFSRFAAQLDEETRQTLERGRRVREVLKQDETNLLDVADQIIVLLAATQGVFDPVPLEHMDDAQEAVLSRSRERLPDFQ